MGSNPVTATKLPPQNVTAPNVDLLPTLSEFFTREAPAGPGDALLVAFSGGPDSTALLLGLRRLTRQRRLRLHAAHLDHALDPGSADRAARAAGIAALLGVPARVERRPVATRRAGESVEAAARRVRYAFLEEARRCIGARWIVTAHHMDDQAETVVLRLLYGSGLAGLAGIRPVQGRVVRPLLALPRSALAEAVAAAGIEPVEDPTNRDPAAVRNLVRHRLLPRLAAGDLDLVPRLAALAAAARGAGERVEARLLERLSPRPTAGGVALDRTGFQALPPALQAPALALLHRRAGAPYPAPGGARRELLRQLCAGRGAVGCDCGGGWRWETRGAELALVRCSAPTDGFSYTLQVPGEVRVPEIGARVRLTRGPVAAWMLAGRPDRAGMALPIRPGDEVEIRSRRPGDRLQPLGRSRPRRLKEVLIDRKVPRRSRDALPLLCVGGSIAWVPGVTVDHRFRLAGQGEAWIAEVVAG